MEGGCSSGKENYYADLYKNSGRKAQSQEERRELFLTLQKEKRNSAFDEKRNLSEFDGKHQNQVEVKRKTDFVYRLMEAEWLVEVPQDSKENWVCKFCPAGIRYLVIAEKGCTTCYMKNSKKINTRFKLKTNFPGSTDYCNRFTILDCVYNEPAKTFIIFDVLAWNSLSMLNLEAQFRFYWLKSKFEENPNLQCNSNKYKFTVMDCVPAEPTLIQDCLSNPFTINEVDVILEGILFYHKESLYSFRRTPLVCWLRSFMIPEKLGIDVPVQHLQNIPDNYINLESFLAQKKEKKVKKNKSLDTMDVQEIEENSVRSLEEN